MSKPMKEGGHMINPKKKFIISKKQCQSRINPNHVCEGCGGKLEPIKTVDNAGNPTYWVGCNHCQCFRGGIEKIYFQIARQLVEKGTIIPYHHMDKHDYKSQDELEYWLDTQTQGLSYVIKEIDSLLKKLKGGKRKEVSDE